MKRLALILLLLLPVMLFSQNINYVAQTTLTASAGYAISMTPHSGPWALYVIPGTVSGTCTVDCQVSPDGTNWVAYPGTVQDTLATNTMSVFSGATCSFALMRLYFTIGTAGCLPVKCWYTIKK